MKRLRLTLSCLSIGFLCLTACNNNSTSENEGEKDPECTYSYDETSNTLEWTAFKFTSKTPVKGTFNNINLRCGKQTDKDPKAVIESMQIEIETSSVETQNEERNGKIAKLFFGTIKTPTLIGKNLSLLDNGKAKVTFVMNGNEQSVEGTYQLIDGTFKLDASIDVAKWNALPGIDALNKACKDLHTGPDGQSKLWSEVSVSFSTNLKKECK